MLIRYVFCNKNLYQLAGSIKLRFHLFPNLWIYYFHVSLHFSPELNKNTDVLHKIKTFIS